MRADKIEIASSGFAGAADELKVFIAHPYDEAALCEVVRAAGAGCVVLFEDDAAAVPFHLSFFVPCVAGDAESIFAKTSERGEAMTAWGLQSHEHADRFEDRGFPLGIVAGEDGAGFGCFEIERLKAPEVHQSQRADHGVFITPEFACGKRAIEVGGQIVFLREIFLLDHFPCGWQIWAWICFRVPSPSRMLPCR